MRHNTARANLQNLLRRGQNMTHVGCCRLSPGHLVERVVSQNGLTEIHYVTFLRRGRQGIRFLFDGLD